MGSVFYVIAIMGCSDGQAQCAEARVESARYQNAAQCQAAMPKALLRNTDLDFPTIMGACRQIGTSMADRPGKDGGGRASIG